MIELRSAEARGRTDWGWLDSRHTFSFGEYHDPAHMGFRTLRVINDDRVKPGAAFGRHGHRDMEILSYVLEGVLEHQDSSGGGGVIRLKPAYGQQAFDRDMASRVFVLLASKEGRDGSLQIHQDVDLWGRRSVTRIAWPSSGNRRPRSWSSTWRETTFTSSSDRSPVLRYVAWVTFRHELG